MVIAHPGEMKNKLPAAHQINDRSPISHVALDQPDPIVATFEIEGIRTETGIGAIGDNDLGTLR
jgi:hypothetical protein